MTWNRSGDWEARLAKGHDTQVFSAASETGPESMMVPWPLCRLQGLSDRDLSLTSLDHKFFVFAVAMYPPHTPESGTRHLREATVWERKEWRRLAPKK